MRNCSVSLELAAIGMVIRSTWEEQARAVGSPKPDDARMRSGRVVLHKVLSKSCISLIDQLDRIRVWQHTWQARPMTRCGRWSLSSMQCYIRDQRQCATDSMDQDVTFDFQSRSCLLRV